VIFYWYYFLPKGGGTHGSNQSVVVEYSGQFKKLGYLVFSLFWLCRVFSLLVLPAVILHSASLRSPLPAPITADLWFALLAFEDLQRYFLVLFSVFVTDFT